eukprot:744805-Pleurochrysis_carterae.AAC.1
MTSWRDIDLAPLWLVSGPRRLRPERVPLYESAGKTGHRGPKEYLLGDTFPATVMRRSSVTVC